MESPATPDAAVVATRLDEYVAALRNAGEPQQAAVGHGLNTARSIFIQEFGTMAGFRDAGSVAQLEFIARMDAMAKGLDAENTGMSWGVRLFWMYAYLLKDGDEGVSLRYGPELARLGQLGMGVPEA